jgi:hypothetical protein
MANKIVLKKSSVAAKVPLATDLDIGELAVNLADAKLYSKDASGTVIQIGGGGGGGSGTVTSVALSGGTTGLTTTGSPITTSGTITLGGTLAVANGGTGVTSSSGANSVVLRDANNNITANAYFNGFTSVAASGTQITLTVASTPVYLVTGSGGQTIQLPNATTLPNGTIFSFNNNQSSGAITVNNNSGTLIASVPSGGYVTVVLNSNANAAGSWDRHDQSPSNVSWSTNTLDYAGSITSATWNGTSVAVNRGGTGATTAATARTNLGATTVGSNVFTLTNPSAITFPQFNADNTVSALDAATFRTAIGAGTSSTTGTVTSVSGTGTVSGLTLTGTVTTSGSLTLGGTLAVTASNFSSQTANTVLAAPNGAAGVPSFRSIVAADIPTLNQNTTGTASNVTGTVAIANGGSGATTAQTAMNAFAGAVTSGSYLRGTGTNVVMSTIQAADVPTLNQNTTGSAASVSISGQTGLLTFTGLTTVNRAKTVRDAADTILELGGSYTPTGTWNWSTATATWPTFNQNTTGTASNVTGTVAVANGGTGQTTYTNGQLLIGNTTGGTLTKATLTQGTGITISNGAGSITVTNSAPDQTVAFTNGTGISVTGTYPNFTVTNTSPSSGGTVTSVSGTGTVAGISLSGTVTSSGNISLGGTFALPTGQVPGKMIYDSFTATAGQTTFTTSTTYTSSKIQVMVNGCTMVNGSDVTVTSGTSIVFATGLTVNDRVTAIYPT